jgi:hypothetical protein
MEGKIGTLEKLLGELSVRDRLRRLRIWPRQCVERHGLHGQELNILRLEPFWRFGVR